MTGSSLTRIPSTLVSVVVPVLSAAVIPWGGFSAVPVTENVYYDIAWGQLLVVNIVALLAVSLFASTLLFRGEETPSPMQLLIMLASGAGAVGVLWFSTPLVVVTRLEALLTLWSALLVVWAIGMVRSLIVRRKLAASADQVRDRARV